MASLARSSVEQTFTCEVEPQIGSYSYSILNTPLNSIKNLKTKNQGRICHHCSTHILPQEIASRLKCTYPGVLTPTIHTSPLRPNQSILRHSSGTIHYRANALLAPVERRVPLSLSALRNTSHDYSFNIDRGVGCLCTSRFIALYDFSDDTGIGVSLSSQRGHTVDHLVGWHGCQQAAGSLWVEEQRVCVVLGRFVLLFTGCLEEWENK